MTLPGSNVPLRGAVDLSALRNRPAAASPSEPAAGAPAGGNTARLVIDVTDAMFPEVLELSKTVPVVVDLWAEWCGPCKQLSPVLERVVTEHAGRLVLAKVDVDANPQLAQAFRAQSIPMVVALVGGQAVPLFTGAVPEQQVREVFAQLLQLAAQNGVTGSVGSGDADAADEEGAAAEPAMPPLHAEAFAAIESGDYAAAISAYERALAENPRDAPRCGCSLGSRMPTSRPRAQRLRLLRLMSTLSCWSPTSILRVVTLRTPLIDCSICSRRCPTMIARQCGSGCLSCSASWATTTRASSGRAVASRRCCSDSGRPEGRIALRQSRIVEGTRACGS